MENKVDIQEARTLLLSVEGMTCGSCVGHVERAVHTVVGVVDVTIDRPSKKVRIVTHHDDADAFVRAIALAGYVAQRIAA